MSTSRIFPILGILAAVGLGLLASTSYWQDGYGVQVLAAWVAALLLGLFAFRGLDTNRAGGPPMFDRTDGRLLLLLVLVFAPLYLAFVYFVPHQINTDEITIMIASSDVSARPDWDFFSLSHYFRFPSFIFMLYGALGRLAGGINLANMRAIHASFGVVIIALSYLLFRTMLSRRLALAAAIVLGANHALLAISRMAMRDNSSLLIEVAALLLLFVGYQRNRLGLSFVGGAVAGLSFYVYEPSRMTFVIWVVFLLLAAAIRASKETLRKTVRVAVPGVVGFVLVVSPLAVASIQIAQIPDAFQYQQKQLLFTSEGQELQREWVDAETVIDGIRTNVYQGIFAFNARLHDQGYIYFNPGHGFVDPLTGVLIWVGVAMILSRLRRMTNTELLMLTGFFLFWLIFSFVTTKAPSYTRLLMTLPFVAYLAVRGAEWIGKQLHRLFEWRKQAPSYSVSSLAIWVLVAAIVIWNLTIFGDFVVNGFIRGDEVGGVARYVHQRHQDEKHSFFVLASEEYPFYDDERANWWEFWIRFLDDDEHSVAIIDQHIDEDRMPSVPFTIFMGREDWRHSSEFLTAKYPHRTIHHIVADGSMIAVEVQEPQSSLQSEAGLTTAKGAATIRVRPLR